MTKRPPGETRAEYMRRYRAENPAYETGGPKRDPELDRSKPEPGEHGVKNNPEYHKRYMRWKRDQR